MPTIDYSTLAEIELKDSWLEDPEFYYWLRHSAKFSHNSEMEFIHHLYPDESEDWYVNNCLYSFIPEDLKNLLLKSRRDNCARVCFYI